MKLERMTPGMVLHAYGRRCSCPVRVLEVSLKTCEVFASWNNSPPRWCSGRHATKWRKVAYEDAQRAKAKKETTK